MERADLVSSPSLQPVCGLRRIGTSKGLIPPPLTELSAYILLCPTVPHGTILSEF